MDFEKFVSNALALEDEFTFGCTACGDCCRDTTIILNPHDIFRIATELHMKTNDFVRQYCIITIGPGSKLPVAQLHMIGKRCPFLKDDHCSIHRVKPSVCALYPLGRMYLSDEDRIIYFLQDVSCRKAEQRQTVRNWAYPYSDAKEQEDIFKLWSTMLPYMANFMRSVPDYMREIMENILISELYTDYDIEADFLLQLRKKDAKIRSLLADLDNLVSQKSVEKKGE